MILTARIDFPAKESTLVPSALLTRNNPPSRPPLIRGVRLVQKAVGLVVIQLDDHNTIVCDRTSDDRCFYGWSNLHESFVMVELNPR